VTRSPKMHAFAPELTSAQRATLKGLAHSLRPVVLMGGDGLTDGVVAEITRALEDHELIKIQVPGNNSAGEKRDALEELKGKLPERSHVVGRIGRTVILYQEQDPEEAKILLKNIG
jgi:RNA-binding protein